MNSELKEQTSAKHKIAERKNFNTRMFKGELQKQEYLTYLEQQSSIFRELEKYPLPHPSLHRTKKIEEDILELTNLGCELNGELASKVKYTRYLSKLSPDERLPHIYLHYLAIMYGGQMMNKKVPSQGHFYNFDDFEDCILSIRRIQQNSWVEEVNRGYDFIIDIFDNLEKHCFNIKPGNNG